MNSTVSEYFYFYINCCLVLQQTRHNHYPAYIKSATVVDVDWLFLFLIGFLFHHRFEILRLLLQFFLQPWAVPPDYLQAAVSAWFSLLLIVFADLALLSSALFFEDFDLQLLLLLLDFNFELQDLASFFKVCCTGFASLFSAYFNQSRTWCLKGVKKHSLGFWKIFYSSIFFYYSTTNDSLCTTLLAF